MKPPTHLGKHGRKLWRTIDSGWALDNYGHQILQFLAECYDRMWACRDVLAVEGFTITTGAGMVRAHPILKVEKEARVQFLAAWRLLRLDTEPPQELGRPPGS